jgi:hypothetical protein
MKKLSLILLVAILFLLLSCAQNIKNVVYPALNDDQYDSEFPYKNCSRELEEISRSVHKVIYTAYYKTYQFNRKFRLLKEQVNEKSLYKSESIDYNNHSIAGTATVIYSQLSNVALLASAHNVNQVDTLYTYYGKLKQKTEFIQSISIKQSERISVPDLPDNGLVKILAQDRERDIAILGKTYKKAIQQQIPVFDYPFGNAKKLQWGSFVYLFGFPKGLKMITRGIVSDPHRDKHGNFLVDALINRGFSGGIILAIRDGAPNFEFVGLGISTSSDEGLFLVPDMDENFSENSLYNGDIYVERKSSINYGICRAVSAEAVVEMMRDNSDLLLKQGFDFSGFYGK